MPIVPSCQLGAGCIWFICCCTSTSSVDKGYLINIILLSLYRSYIVPCMLAVCPAWLHHNLLLPSPAPLYPPTCACHRILCILSVQTLAHAYPSASMSFAFMRPCTRPSQQAATLAYLGTMQLTLPQQSYGWHTLCRCRAYMQHWLHCIHGVWKNHCDHLATHTNTF